LGAGRDLAVLRARFDPKDVEECLEVLTAQRIEEFAEQLRSVDGLKSGTTEEFQRTGA